MQRLSDKFCNYIEIKEKKLVILDLDGTIIDSDINSITITPDTHIIKVQGIDYKITMRPHFKEFKKWLFDNYKVAIWTNALMIYAIPILKILFEEHYKELLFIWDRNKSVSCLYDNSLQLMKPLNKVIEEFPIFSIDDIVIIEDTPSNCISDIDNCYSIYTYSTDNNIPDTGLLEIMEDFHNGFYSR